MFIFLTSVNETVTEVEHLERLLQRIGECDMLYGFS